MAEPFQLPSDRELVAATRAGSDQAWGELGSRHRDAVAAVARARDRRGADQAADEALAALREEIRNDSVDAASTDFAVRAVRPRALVCLTGGTYAPTAAETSTAVDQPSSSTVRPARTGGEEPDASMPAADTGADLAVLAVAFGRLSEPWQTVLWHRLVESEPAASLTAMLGRSPTEVIALESSAERGLFDAYTAVELETDGAVSGECRPIVALLPGYHRGTLADAQRRQVAAHLGAEGGATRRGDGGRGEARGDSGAGNGCADCRRRLALPEAFGVALPLAVVPGVTGLSVVRYREALGVGVVAIGVSALAAQRSQRANRWARLGAAAVIIIALLGAALLIRSPFDDLDGRIADLIEQSTTTVPPGDGGVVTIPPVDTTDTSALPSRIELLFPGVPQGVVYVPGGPALSLGLNLSAPAPVYRGGTGTIDLGITNELDVATSVTFVVRTSAGVTFDELAEGDAACESAGTAGASCALDLGAGSRSALSLRFALDSTVSDRLVVVPSIRSNVLDLPVETVPGLLLGLVGRGELLVAGNDIGACDGDDCSVGGEPIVSSAILDLPPGAEVDEALLVWQVDGTASDELREVGLIAPGDSTGQVVAAEPGEPVDSRFRSVADVTAIVQSAGGGEYAVVGPTKATDGWWTLLVVTRQSASTRELFVVVDPLRTVRPDSPVEIVVPIAPPAPAGAPRSPTRDVVVVVQDVLGPTAGAQAPAIEMSVDGQSPPGEPIGSGGTVTSYALSIDSTEDALSVAVSTSTVPFRIAAIGLSVDIVQ
ncbi:MAG: hypothetical protein WBL31_02180 [Ilumatobacteraceae bacterium]